MQDVLQSQTKELDKANKVGIVCVTLINSTLYQSSSIAKQHGMTGLNLVYALKALGKSPVIINWYELT